MEITSPIGFLARRHLYETEKPYRLKFETSEDFPPTNIETEAYDQKLHDVRGRESDYSLANNGFELLALEDRMTYEDYDDEERVRQVYLKQIAEGVKKILKASRVQIFEHVVRKRQAQFPLATGEAYEYNQPTTTAHVDMTPGWAAETVLRLNEANDVQLPSEKYQFINIWKPIRGPVRDWPLALCDPRTVRIEDLQPSDLVFRSVLVENYMVRCRAEQQWYYLSDQTACEAWMFLQADSDATGFTGVPHSSFLHPHSKETDDPRESIEVRAVVYFD